MTKLNNEIQQQLSYNAPYIVINYNWYNGNIIDHYNFTSISIRLLDLRSSIVILIRILYPIL